MDNISDIISMLPVIIVATFFLLLIAVPLFLELIDKIPTPKKCDENTKREIDGLEKGKQKTEDELNNVKAESEESQAKLKETQARLRESEDRYDQLYKGEIPKEKEEKYELKIAQLESELKAVTQQRDTLRADFERKIGYSIFDGTKKPMRKPHSDTSPSPSLPSNSELPVIPDFPETPSPTTFPDSPIVPETETFEKYTSQRYADVPTEIAELTTKLEENQALFEEGLAQMSKVFSASHNLDALLARVKDGRLNNAFGTDTHFSNIEIIADAPSSSEESSETYLVTLFDCTCKSYTKGNPTKLPCKHMVYLAYELGILQINREQCRKHFKYSIENATKIAPLPKSKKEAETARNRLSQL